MNRSGIVYDFYRLKLSGKALYFTVFISIVVAVLISLFIAHNYLYRIEIIRLTQSQKLMDNVNSAITYALADKSIEPDAKSYPLDLFKDESVIEVTKEKWGAFTLLQARSSWKSIKYSKVILGGVLLFPEERKGLYLADRGKYLSIAGDTYLGGVSYLPKIGIKSEYIDGTPYKGKQMLYGDKKESSPDLPGLNGSVLEEIKSLLEYEENSDIDSVISADELYLTDSCYRSFDQKRLVFYSAEFIEIDGITLSGKIIVRSEKGIRITKDAETDHILAVAPVIEIEDNFEGNLQIVARDTVLIGENVNMSYPSNIVAYNYAGNSANVVISEESILSGCVLIASGVPEQDDSQLIIKEDATVNGLVYCNGKTSIRGTVTGTLYCRNFVLFTRLGMYENHLLDAIIDPESLSENFVVPDLFGENSFTREIECLK